MIDDATRRQWRRMFDARTAGPWAHEPGSGKVISITYRRGVAEVTHFEDADFVAQAYEGWPRTLEALEATERERDKTRNDLDSVLSSIEENLRTISNQETELQNAYETCRIAVMRRDEAREETDQLRELAATYTNRVSELIQMFTAWRKHRNSPLLIADFENYSRRHK